MDLGLGIALLLVLAFAFTNGVHDASNAIATLVATRVARPTQALLLAAVFNTARTAARRRGGRGHDRRHRRDRRHGGDRRDRVPGCWPPSRGTR